MILAVSMIRVVGCFCEKINIHSGGEACFVCLNLCGWASSLLFRFVFFQPHPRRLGGVLFVSMVLAVSMILYLHDPCCVHDPFVFLFSTAPSKVGRCCCCCPRGFVPQGKLFFCPRCFVPLSSSLFLRVSSPKGSWGSVDDAALASRLFLGVFSPKGS